MKRALKPQSRRAAYHTTSGTAASGASAKRRAGEAGENEGKKKKKSSPTNIERREKSTQVYTTEARTHFSHKRDVKCGMG